MLAQPIQKLLREYRAHKDSLQSPDAGTVIHVDEVAFKIARFYERVRNLVDYQEEHLLRKRVIYRALQRRIIFEPEKHFIAESLIKEIIRSGHLKNDAIPESKIAEVQMLIDQLFVFFEGLANKEPKIRARLSQWCIQLSASAIEECLDPPIADRLLSTAMFESLKGRLSLKEAKLSEAETNAQLFIAIERALLRVDEDQLDYRFLKFVYPHWDAPSSEELASISQQLPAIYANIRAHTKHSLGPHFFKLCNRFNTVFYLIGDCIFRADDPLHSFEEILDDEDRLQESISHAYAKRYRDERRHLTRLAFLSVLSLFISKVIIALAVEIPIDRYITHSYSFLHMMVNIIVPPTLMFVIISFIRLPSAKNLDIIYGAVRNVLYGPSEETAYLVMVPKGRNPFVQQLINGFYFLWSLMLFVAVALGLRALEFSIASTAVFILFLCLVVATGVKVHNRSKEISMEEERTTFLVFFYDLTAMPFALVGKWVIAGLSRFHFLVILINFIDLPFQLLIDFIENLHSFVRSKRDAMY